MPQPQRNDAPQSFEMGVLPSVGGEGRGYGEAPGEPPRGAHCGCGARVVVSPRPSALSPWEPRPPPSPPKSLKPGSDGARRGSAPLPGGAKRVNNVRPFTGDSRWFYGTVKLSTSSLYIDMTVSLGSCVTRAHTDPTHTQNRGVTGRRERAERERGPAHASSPGPR